MSDPNASLRNPKVSSDPSNVVYSRGALLGAHTGGGRIRLAAIPRSEHTIKARIQKAKSNGRISDATFECTGELLESWRLEGRDFPAIYNDSGRQFTTLAAKMSQTYGQW